MIEVGSRFKNLEKVFGPGVAVVVGCDIAESTYAPILRRIRYTVLTLQMV
jgi:hypothetical protein